MPPKRVPLRTAEKWIRLAHELEAESFRMAEFGYNHDSQAVRRASVSLGDAGRHARDQRS